VEQAAFYGDGGVSSVAVMICAQIARVLAGPFPILSLIQIAPDSQQFGQKGDNARKNQRNNREFAIKPDRRCLQKENARGDSRFC
jgi:hypothetical protein